ncbi:redoxin domain-containing protein [Demequina sp.]|uniref:redoxin domain-containing protein n=1 Tax=Demequina sp. TaxID=2050685 RepID=UPI0025B9E05B|nr:redoxin domain-containing protein [Demequina sp.]
MTHPLVGHAAPEFTLSDQDGINVSLSALRGSDVLLVFVPWAFSPVCTYELEQLRDAEDLVASDAHVLVVNCDSKFVNQEWAHQNKFPGTLLSDFWPHGAVSREYGVFDEELGRSKRGTFHVNADGLIDWALVSPSGDARDLEEYRKVLGLV